MRAAPAPHRQKPVPAWKRYQVSAKATASRWLWTWRRVDLAADCHRLAYVAEEEGRQLVVVGESERLRYDEVLGGLVVFDPSTSLHYLARRGNEVLLVEEVIEQG